MVISIKDSVKLIGISIVCFCAVFVSTFFINFYLDAPSIEHFVTDETRPLYDAQLVTAQFSCAISGGFLAVIAVVMLVFYIKLYVDSHSRQLGILKAMGYSDSRIALKFWVFGLSVLVGTALGYGCGYAIMPTVYSGMAIEGLPEIEISFHPALIFELIVLPAVLFALLACGYAYFALRRPVSEMLRGEKSRKKKDNIKTEKEGKERSFLKDMCLRTLGSRKLLAFFVAIACFCFSAMMQMGASMRDLSSETMGIIMFLIGIALSVTALFMAITSLIKGNIKNISIMKAFGYSMKECALTVLGAYVPFAFLGFALGTIYQYVLLAVMVNVVFANVGEVPDYSFDVPLFFITLAVFIVLYFAVMLVYAYKMSKISVKEIMMEN